MAIKVFLDTNIFLDFLDVSRDGHFQAIEIFKAIEVGKIKGYLSESVINTASYLVRKWMDKNIFKEIVIDLMQIITILPCSNSIIEQGYRNAKNDLEDAVLYQIAAIAKLEYFITLNIKDLKKLEHHSLPVITSQKLLDTINA